MYVVFIHGPAASGKFTVGSALAARTGLPLFHNHLAVDAAKSLFAFGTSGFNRVRASVWRTAFVEAASAGQSFIFTFHPEASVDPGLIDELCQAVTSRAGRVHFVELTCSRAAVLERIASDSRARFGKLTDPKFYASLESEGAFRFPPLPAPLLVVDTETLAPDLAAEKIERALAATALKA
jgi:hypothetical protein